MSVSDYVQIGIAVGGGLGSATVGLLWKLVLNIAELNKNIAVIVERVDSHEKRIDRLETVTSP